MAFEPNSLDELYKRLTRLERASARPRRGSLNQKQAAEYLNRSEEWLRREHGRRARPKASQARPLLRLHLPGLGRLSRNGRRLMRGFTHITKENPGNAVTRAGAEGFGSWIDSHDIQHPYGTLQVVC